jgi:glycosyltransferase involved in cell wall biosynthesis
MPARTARVAAVIPCYRVERHIVDVIRTLPPLVSTVVVVDDRSPDNFVERVEALNDPRVVLLRHEVNQGVGGALVTGYRECLRRNVDVVVKVDGDGQMPPEHLPALLRPLLRGLADYTKGNRWHSPQALASMPGLRRLGNSALSFLTKAATGYWRIFDPCNGYTAIRACVLRRVPLERLARNYFFETSMLLQLNALGAVVKDVPIPACYGDEVSSLRVRRVLWQFPLALLKGGLGRLWARHFVRDFGPLALCLSGACPLLSWGVGFSSWQWLRSILTNVPATPGTVMLGALPIVLGFQLLLQAGQLDLAAEPKEPLCSEEGPLAEPAPFSPEAPAKAA